MVPAALASSFNLEIVIWEITLFCRHDLVPRPVSPAPPMGEVARF